MSQVRGVLVETITDGESENLTVHPFDFDTKCEGGLSVTLMCDDKRTVIHIRPNMGVERGWVIDVTNRGTDPALARRVSTVYA